MTTINRGLRSEGGGEIDRGPRPDRSDAAAQAVELSVTVGSLRLPNPVMTASGTAGYGVELDSYVPLRTLGAVVSKSLAAFSWAGNPPPRLHPTAAGLLNSVGLQGPGVSTWVDHDLPALARAGARVVASVWGRSVEEYRLAALALNQTDPAVVVAVEINLSCPNLAGDRHLFAQSPADTAAVVAACKVAARPLWAKLTPVTDRITEVADAAGQAGAEAVTLINTAVGMLLDPGTRRPVLGGGGGGLSGPALHPIAVRAVYDVHAASPDLAIIGVGGVSSGWDAVELLLAGASAVQVGTATFADPRAPGRVLAELTNWCGSHGVRRVADLRGTAHGG